MFDRDGGKYNYLTYLLYPHSSLFHFNSLTGCDHTPHTRF